MRFATFNASLNREQAGDLRVELGKAVAGKPTPQVRAVLDIIRRNDPDVLLINEFDYDDGHGSAALFAALAGYEHHFTAPANTGVPSGLDLGNDGSVGGPGNAFGFGFHPGQFGMLVLSRLPVVSAELRTFRMFRWRDMPGAMLPTEPDGSGWYSEEALDVFRLSSKSHWDVPLDTGSGVVHFLVSHPTPPAFDGPEGRNVARNHDEIRLWADYISPGSRSDYLYDDKGRRGGLNPGSSFVVAGDQNADPARGRSAAGAINQLLGHPLVNTGLTPASPGAAEASAHGGPLPAGARFRTADFGDPRSGGPGRLRVDYVLPSIDLELTDGGVFWPSADDPLSALTGTYPFPSSDHRLVWVDVFG